MVERASGAEQVAPRASSSSIHVEIAGEGPPLLFTHGFGDSGETWDAQIPAFGRSFRTLRWDLPGHGRSERPENPDVYSRESALAHLDALVARLGPQVVLIGHSLGGYLSQCHTLLRPERVRALVLIATGPGFRDPAARERWNRGVQRVAQRFGVPIASTRMVEQHDSLVMDGLERIRCPVLLITGERDSAYHGAADYAERRLPDARSLRVAGGGHHVHRSHPEVVNAAIERFLGDLPRAVL